MTTEKEEKSQLGQYLSSTESQFVWIIVNTFNKKIDFLKNEVPKSKHTKGNLDYSFLAYSFDSLVRLG